MSKILLLSILIGPIAIPARLAKLKNPRLGLRKTLIQMAIFHAVYLFSLMYIYSHL
jgi:hypothetical protein